jgi:hypothetical protein
VVTVVCPDPEVEPRPGCERHTVKRVLERTGQEVKVFKKGTKVAASKGRSSTGKLRAIQSLEDWCVWASKAATQTGLDTVGAQANATGRNSES